MAAGRSELLDVFLAFGVGCLVSGGHALDNVLEDELRAVRVAQGDVRGRRVESVVGGAFFSFQGLPYARPPVGPLRFKDAQPPEPWMGVRHALKEGQKCTQFYIDDFEYTGGEDCLFLNVYTPRLPETGAELAPVMVYFHGGGFVFGSGNADTYGPDYLVNEGVALVTINYRLGPFGFLHLGQAAPGNAGLKDQVAALRWVQKNIAAFGGDPKRVTIFGESAGGASVHHHVMSPLSEGLFQAAIAQSGSALNPWAIQNDPQETTHRLARAVGCDGADDFTIVECLRGIDNMKLMKASREDAPTEKDSERLLHFSFVPSPETVTEGVETFASEPFGRLVEGRFNRVPFMTGITSQEGLLLLAFNTLDFHNASVQKELDAAWEKKVLPELRLPVDAARTEEALKELRQFYLDGKPLTNNTLHRYIDMFSDLTFGEGIAYSLNHMAHVSKTPLYLYYFNIDDQLNFLKWQFKLSFPGASHADDLGYLFNVARLERTDSSAAAAKARHKVVRLWTNFAKSGNPTPADDQLLSVQWKPYTEEKKNYLEINHELTAAVDLYAKRFEFWEYFYRKFSESIKNR